MWTCQYHDNEEVEVWITPRSLSPLTGTFQNPGMQADGVRLTPSPLSPSTGEEQDQYTQEVESRATPVSLPPLPGTAPDHDVQETGMRYTPGSMSFCGTTARPSLPALGGEAGVGMASC